MGTKLNPGEFDCYAAAAEDEPMFVLLARDSIAPHMVRIWAAVKCGDAQDALEQLSDAFKCVATNRGDPFYAEWNSPKMVEARACADTMEGWERK